jgi:hypothetical protein
MMPCVAATIRFLAIHCERLHALAGGSSQGFMYGSSCSS